MDKLKKFWRLYGFDIQLFGLLILAIVFAIALIYLRYVNTHPIGNIKWEF